MHPVATRDKTITFKPPTNWDQEADGPCGDLEVRVDTYGDSKIVQHVSTWKPSHAELAMLNRGGVVEIALLVPKQPVIAAYVVEPADGQ